MKRKKTMMNGEHKDTGGENEMVKVRKRDGRLVEFVESKIVAGVRRAGATAKEAAQVAKEVSAKVTHRVEITAEELSNRVVTSLKKVNKTASEEFVKFRDKKLKAKNKKLEARKVLDKATISRILRIAPRHEGFHFYREQGNPTGKIAISLPDFVEKMRVADIRSINFHFKRKDFEKWIREVVGDAELSSKISKIQRESHGEKLREEIIRIINGRLEELKSM